MGRQVIAEWHLVLTCWGEGFETSYIFTFAVLRAVLTVAGLLCDLVNSGLILGIFNSVDGIPSQLRE